MPTIATFYSAFAYIGTDGTEYLVPHSPRRFIELLTRQRDSIAYGLTNTVSEIAGQRVKYRAERAGRIQITHEQIIEIEGISK